MKWFDTLNKLSTISFSFIVAVVFLLFVVCFVVCVSLARAEEEAPTQSDYCNVLDENPRYFMKWVESVDEEVMQMTHEKFNNNLMSMVFFDCLNQTRATLFNRIIASCEDTLEHDVIDVISSRHAHCLLQSYLAAR